MTFAAHLAQKSVTLCLGSDRWALSQGRPFRLGRHKSNDLWIDDPRVSRFHAQVAWNDGVAWLEDLQSTNGTFLDGERLAGPVPLLHGARVRVGEGGLELSVEVGEAEAPALLPESSDDDTLTLWTEHGAQPQEGAFAAQADLHRLLLDLEDQERTGTLELELGVRRASLTFCLGRVVRARHRQLTGLQALERILRGTTGRYGFTPHFTPGEGTLGLSVRRYLRQGYWAAATRRVTR